MEQVAVGMSGGVDSSTAAWLLKQAGYDVVSVTLNLFGRELLADQEENCCVLNDVQDARAVADHLGIAHYVFDLSSCFRAQVVDPFVTAYERGATPNPCVDCNRALKFGALLQQVRAHGWNKIATGHYVRSRLDEGTGRWLLYKAAHPEKDQSYVLYCLNQDQLAHSLFPLGELEKEEIRAIAERQGLITARKRDSQDICFIPDGDYAAFIRRYTGREYPEGPFLDEAGNQLGIHSGIIGYTVGQRRGLGVSSNSGRLYVKQVLTDRNAVVLSGNESLFSRTLIGERLNLIACEKLDRPVKLRAKVRYRMTEQPCTVEQIEEDRVRVCFDTPQRAITPGQSVVFYDGDVVVGGAVIQETEREERKPI